MGKGLSVEDSKIVACTLAKYPEFWAEHMLLHEVGILPPSEDDGAYGSAAAMFISFAIFGSIPILSYIAATRLIFTNDDQDELARHGFMTCCVVSLFTLFLLGAVKNKIADQNWLKGGGMMMGQGCVAGLVSYGIGSYFGSQPV